MKFIDVLEEASSNCNRGGKNFDDTITSKNKKGKIRHNYSSYRDRGNKSWVPPGALNVTKKDMMS